MPLGGILPDSKLVWQSKEAYLEIRDTKRGLKVGSWTFGSILKDSNTKIVDVKELQKSSGKLALLVVALECSISGGIICLFNVFSSKVIRAIHIKQKVCSLVQLIGQNVFIYLKCAKIFSFISGYKLF